MNQIKQFRKKHKLSQRELADLVGVNYRTVQFWEAGKRNPRLTIFKLLERLEIELAGLEKKGE